MAPLAFVGPAAIAGPASSPPRGPNEAQASWHQRRGIGPAVGSISTHRRSAERLGSTRGLVLGGDQVSRAQMSVGRTTMNEEALNPSVRKFLWKFGVMAQRELETAVRAADAKGQLKGSDRAGESCCYGRRYRSQI
jgi:hypothetical protein